MICSKCGTQNKEGSKFCIGCGNNIANTIQENNQQPMYQQNVVFQPQNNISNSEVINNNGGSKKVSFSEYFFFLLAVILKPFTAFKEELSKFSDLKNSAILSLIVSVVATLVSLIKTIINVVRVENYSWLGETTVTWTWENLKNINYFQVIGKNLLVYLGIVVVIAGVYYLASLIIKKQVNFARLLGISASAVVPLLICSLALSPLLSMIYAPLGMAVSIIGLVYTIIILYEAINHEIKLEGNAKLYFNLVCLSILAIAAYYLYVNVFVVQDVSNDLNDILNMFR